MSVLIDTIIYSKNPINVNHVYNIYTPNTKIIPLENSLIFDRHIVYEAIQNNYFNIIYQYIFNDGIVFITDKNLESKTIVIHSESLLYQLVKKNERLLKYFINLKDLNIYMKDENESISQLIKYIKEE